MTELRQAAVLSEKSITTTDTTDFSTLNTFLDGLKQCKDDVNVANYNQTKTVIQALKHIDRLASQIRNFALKIQTVYRAIQYEIK
ncbi:hypothetical protein CHS0354_021376 [Potamilus streckersoni]|uniref:Uncharacterized protein n=1 Tax=Potamilus streckersoni TaxID=2493646 RepID=A0AAE0S3U7_9BIVA|nr:hypothetical protein CHS0354_021376 [Potamilus streckersoni]